MAGVAEGIAHAHANGVIHRDIKPHNLLFGPDRQLYITDFGLAHLTSEPHLTITGEVLGTPSYMSPEQARGDLGAITDRTDIYSFGATLYEMVTGHRPFERDSRHQIIDAVCHDEPPRPRRLDRRVPIDLETICLRAIEKEPKRRYDSAAALAEDLRRFSEDRPILSRRIGVMERAAKWTRRHKAIATAAVIAVALVTVSTGWAVSTVAGHRRDGDLLVQSVYDQLVYRNYDNVGLVTADIERAEALGATDPRFYLIRAMLDLKASDHDRAIERTEQFLDEDPENIEALYFLAWVHYRNQQEERFRDTFAQAEDLGGPRTAEDWFFRGLALHKTDAIEATESYRTASRIRAADDQFFPQAELHLARALNQRIYQTESLETFDEAADTFRGLIKNEHYRGYADYLQSLTFRLAAEIRQGNPDERSRYVAEEYFDKALEWAREGRRQRPESDRPITAEAMCLERLGRLDEALGARDQAIELAEAGEHRCEGHHYRWRLNYWLGNLEEALADIEEHAHEPCIRPDPTTEAAGRLSLSYRYFFPALVHAEGGDLETALELVREASAQEEFGAEAVLLSAAYLRILGEPDAATALLLERMDAARTDPDEASSWADRWEEAMYAFVTDEAAFEVIEELAYDAEFLEEENDKPLIPRRLLGQAHFHAGAKALAAGHRDRAMVAFEKAHRSCDGSTNSSYHGRLMLEQLSRKAGWPAWISVVPEDETEASSTKR
jgi:tetratricopeptide (TPR) repeat protein